VRVFAAQGTEHPSFAGGRFVYSANFTGGVFVAAGDVDGDGRAEIITGAGAGGGPHVRVFNQSWNVVSEFFAYSGNFTGGVRVAAVDVTADERMEIITAAGPGGGPHVRAFSVPPPVQRASYFVFDISFAGGVFVGSVIAPGGTGNLMALNAPALIDRAFERAVEEDEFIAADLDDAVLMFAGTKGQDGADHFLCVLCGS
jgi:hypothetical protein